jgi:hypothetical protein
MHETADLFETILPQGAGVNCLMMSKPSTLSIEVIVMPRDALNASLTQSLYPAMNAAGNSSSHLYSRIATGELSA